MPGCPAQYVVSALAEALPLRYSIATVHFRLGVLCILPSTTCRSTARNTMQAPMPTLFSMLLLPVQPLYLRRSLLVQVVFWFVSLLVTSTLLCFLVAFCLVLPGDALTGTSSSPLVAKCAHSACRPVFLHWLNCVAFFC